jgi:hypothetical protein
MLPHLIFLRARLLVFPELAKSRTCFGIRRRLVFVFLCIFSGTLSFKLQPTTGCSSYIFASKSFFYNFFKYFLRRLPYTILLKIPVLCFDPARKTINNPINSKGKASDSGVGTGVLLYNVPSIINVAECIMASSA